MGHRLFNIIHQYKTGDYQPIEATAVTKTFVKGYIARHKQDYPCCGLLVKQWIDGEIVEEIPPNGKPHVNKDVWHGCHL